MHSPQPMRDQMAASALVAEKLDEPRALIRLGFKLDYDNGGRLRPSVWETCKQIFGTDGVRDILAQNLADANAQKEKIIGRLVQTSIHGTDGESTRAAQQLAKIAGWNEDSKNSAPNVTVNLMQMFAEQRETQAKVVDHDPEAIIDADAFLVHEPGESQRIEDEEPKALTR